MKNTLYILVALAFVACGHKSETPAKTASPSSTPAPTPSCERLDAEETVVLKASQTLLDLVNADIAKSKSTKYTTAVFRARLAAFEKNYGSLPDCGPTTVEFVERMKQSADHIDELIARFPPRR